MIASTNETVNEVLELLQISENNQANLIAEATSPKYLRDLKLNLKSTLKSEHISEKELLLMALALSTNSKSPVLSQSFLNQCIQAGASREEIGDTLACASLMAANNVFYRFRHFMQDEKYNSTPARFRMNIMMSPAIGKELFELISLAVSAVNGCEMCVRSHEQSLREMGCSQERIFDAIRLASIIESSSRLF